MYQYALSSLTSRKTKNKPAVEIHKAPLALKLPLILHILCSAIEGCGQVQIGDGFVFSRKNIDPVPPHSSRSGMVLLCSTTFDLDLASLFISHVSYSTKHEVRCMSFGLFA